MTSTATCQTEENAADVGRSATIACQTDPSEPLTMLEPKLAADESANERLEPAEDATTFLIRLAKATQNCIATRKNMANQASLVYVLEGQLICLHRFLLTKGIQVTKEIKDAEGRKSTTRVRTITL